MLIAVICARSTQLGSDRLSTLTRRAPAFAAARRRSSGSSPRSRWRSRSRCRSLPFHTWLADAHTEAPTVGLGDPRRRAAEDGHLRPLALLHRAVPARRGRRGAAGCSALGAIGIVYGALLAMAQTDLKRLVACSSVSHLGFVVLGLFALTAAGLRGGVLQMVNHGLSTGAAVPPGRHDLRAPPHARARPVRRHRGAMPRLRALLRRSPCCRASGCPGLNGFVGEYLILLGAFAGAPARGVARRRRASSSARSTCCWRRGASCSARSCIRENARAGAT